MSLKDTMEAWARGMAQSVSRQTGVTDSKALAELLRPQLGAVPSPARRLLEPMVAAAAIAALASLASLGAASLAMLLLTAGLIYAILTVVFGIELDFSPPT